MKLHKTLLSPLVAALVLLSVGACGSSEEVAAPANRQAAGEESESTVMTTTLCISSAASAGPMTVQFRNNVANVGTNLEYMQCGRTKEVEFRLRTTLVADIFDSSGNKVMQLRGSNPQLGYPFVEVLTRVVTRIEPSTGITYDFSDGEKFEHEYSVGEGKTYSIDGYSVEIQRFPDDENSKQFRVWID